MGPCFTVVTFQSDSPPLRHLIPLEGAQNEVEIEREKWEEKKLERERKKDKKKSARDAVIKRAREREGGRGGLIHSNEE